MIRSTSSEPIAPRCSRWAVAVLVGLAVTPTGAPAIGQEASDPDPVATALFRSGRDLVGRGEWEAGCEKFAQSLARSVAASTILNLARCREREGKTASAWALYQRALVYSRDAPGERRQQQLEGVAREGLARLEPRLPRLEVRLRAPQPPPAGLRIEEGGRALPLGDAVPLDPGPRDISVTAPGFTPDRRRVELRDGEVTRIEVALHRSGSMSAPDGIAREPAPAAPAAPAAPSRAGVSPWVWFAGATGVAFAGASVAFAVDARATADDLLARCGNDLTCDEVPGYDPSDDNARKNRGVALAIGFGSASLVALGAATFGLVAGSRPSAALLFVPATGGASAAVRASF